MNRKLNVLLLIKDKQYGDKIAFDLTRYYLDINKVFVCNNYVNALNNLKNNSIHILALYLDMKNIPKIISYLKENKRINNVHLIGAYKKEIDLNHSYLSDFDILIKEDKDLKIFSFSLFNSYTNNKKKFKTIELISTSEKAQEKTKLFYNKQQNLLAELHTPEAIKDNQKLISALFKKLSVKRTEKKYKLLNAALLLSMLEPESNLNLIISVLSLNYNITDTQAAKSIRDAIRTIYKTIENQTLLDPIFKDVTENLYPSTKEFLTTISTHLLNTNK